MKSIVFIDSVSRAAGGLFDAERRLHQGLAQKGVETTVLSLADKFTEADLSAWLPLKPEVFSRQAPNALARSAQLHDAMMVQDADLIYRAGLWSLPSRYAHIWSKRHRKPEIIAPHGMLDPWAVRNSAWKKRIAHWLYEGRHLRDAACIRTLCESEANSVRAYGLKNPVVIVPNGIDLPESVSQIAKKRLPPWNRHIAPGRKVVLFLSRIHPKKGLVNLLRAWASLEQKYSAEWALAVAGWDQGGHEAELKQLASSLGIPWADARVSPNESAAVARSSLVFLGPQFNEAKAACYAHCDAFVLPSFSEGLPMVVLEAWAFAKPVLMTRECNLPEGFDAGAAMRLETDAQNIARALTELFSSSASVLRGCGDHGRALVAQKFTWAKVAEDMKNVYDWALGNGPEPTSLFNK